MGIRRAWQSRWLRRMLFFAWLPAVWFGVGFFIWEQSLLYPDWRRFLLPFLQDIPNIEPLRDAVQQLNPRNPDAARHTVWSWLLQSFFRHPQGFLMVMVVGLIAPALISQDLRSRAFLLYFSRPLTRAEYVLGKSATIWTYLLLIATIPALGLYLLGILLSPHIDVVGATWDLPFRILAATAVLVVPTASLALCFSSMTQETRYAGFAWFAVWILGFFTYGMMTSAETFGEVQRQQQIQQQRSNRMRDREEMQRAIQGEIRLEPVKPPSSAWTYLSLYHMLGQVQSWIFGFSPFHDVAMSAGILIGVTIVSNMFLLRRISAPMRA
jgi:ABC-type transport system involved in multi-copper enzyme maturation permease subunit